mgnify:CR=1 FL=1
MSCLNHCPKFDSTKNDYYTTKQMWKNISHLIPKDKIIYEAFLLNSQSKSIDYLNELGFDNVVGNNKLNFITDTLPEFDIIISNPPFETKIKKQILEKLVKLDKPFIIIMNVMNTCSKYFREIFENNLKHLQLIIPQGKIKFEVFNEETKQLEKCKDPSFYGTYVCYKMNITNEDLWLK